MNKFGGILLALMLLLATAISAQKIEMGSWRTHFAYTSVTQMASAGDKVYGLADGALLSVDDRDEVRTYSKLTGLSDNAISGIYSITGTGKLLVAYANSNIDIIDADGYIENINDLYNKSMSVSKQINDVTYRAGKIYLACGFGIAIVNLNRMEFGDTYTIGKNGATNTVLSVKTLGDTLFALTDSSLFVGKLDGTNLMNYQNWAEHTQPTGLNRLMTAFNGQLYLLKADSTLWIYNKQWSKTDSAIANVWSDEECLFIKHGDGRLAVSGAVNFKSLQNNPNAATYDGRYLWFSMYAGVVKMTPKDGGVQYFSFNSPANNYAWRIKGRNGRMMTVPGGRSAINYYRDGYVSWFENGEWSHTGGYSLHEYFPSGWVYDFVNVEIDPQDVHHFWVAGYGIGLAEFRNDEIYKVHSYQNSAIETIFPDGSDFEKNNYMWVDGLTYDTDGRLWMTNNGKAKIKFVERDGTWHTLAHSGLASAKTLQDILIDFKKPTRKYVLCPRYTDSSSSLLFVFDDNNTPEDASDDQTRAFTAMVDQDGKTIFFNDKRLLSIAQDKNGLIWVGTTEGTFTIASNAKIFDSSVRCSRVKISRNDGSGLADYLLGTETINAIAVDGGNRKWFATENGVFLVSEDGQQTIEHFTTENSPLLSNSVLSLGIDEVSGEVFFGTDNGVISYQSDASEGKEDYSEIHAYPNPVRPDYDGVITITGLMEGSYVKICDVNGRTVYETVSNGGVATWDRGDAPSGVYFAMCFNDDKKKGTCKILVLKRQ